LFFPQPHIFCLPQRIAVMVGVVAHLNTSDLPEASFFSQRVTRKKGFVFSKWTGETDKGHSQSEGDSEHSGLPNFQALFPGFDFALVNSIVAETATWEEALQVLLSLADDHVPCEQKHQSLATDPMIDKVAFPPLLDMNGWELIHEDDIIANTGRLWCEMAKDISSITQQCKPRLRDSNKDLLPPREISRGDMAEVLDELEFESEYDCKQRRGIERRSSQAKNCRRPATVNTTKREGKRDQPKDVEPPAWRLCRFEDRL